MRLKTQTSPADAPPLLHRLTAWSGPYAPLLGFLLLGLIGLSLSRFALMLWQWPRVSAAGNIDWMLLQGLRGDLIGLGWFLAPIALLFPLLTLIGQNRLWIRLTCLWLAASLVLVAFLELATPQFILEYDSRPNRLFVEYLAYPREVMSMLWAGYRLAVFGTVIGVAVLGWLIFRHFARYPQTIRHWPAWKSLLVWPLIVLLLFAMIRSTTNRRPINIAALTFCDDAMVNSLVPNSAYSVLSAAFAMRKEDASSEVYGAMPLAEMTRRVRAEMGVAEGDFVSDDYPTLHRQAASVRREKPLNLVIVLEESLGAGFVERLGGTAVTPNLNRLADEGIWFEQLYATGTRSVRGIEAVVAGFPPTPAVSTVKLSKSQRDFFTLASVLRRHGYYNEFIYGGESHFDNMRGFFLGNDFNGIVDRKDFKKPKFVGSWGASDEDLFDMAHERLNTLNAEGKPHFLLVFSSSNHTPFEFPDGRIQNDPPTKQTLGNAVRYADFALGQFIDRAKTSAYWKNTLFVVVADHDTRVYGDALVPVNKFHIPGLILGADITPRKIDSTASQIDLAPTALSLMGIDGEHPFPGRDLTRTLPEFGNASPSLRPRAIMQFNQYYAWMQDDKVTILLPDDGDADKTGEARHFLYDRKTLALTPAAGTDPESDRQVLAQVLMPAWLYREQRYRLPP